MVKLILFNLFKFQPFYSKNSLECLTKIKKTIDRKEFFSDFSKINSSEKNFTFFCTDLQKPTNDTALWRAETLLMNLTA